MSPMITREWFRVEGEDDITIAVFLLFIQFRRSSRAVLLAEDPAIPIGTDEIG